MNSISRYKIVGHESGEGDGGVGAGTIVVHMAGSGAIDAESIDDVERHILVQVAANKRPRGCVYHILPPVDSTECSRALAVASTGEFRRCILDATSGFYSGFHRIRYEQVTNNDDHETDLGLKGVVAA